MRNEREDLKNVVDRLKDAVKTSQEKRQEQASTIQALEKQLESRKRGRTEEEGQTKKEVTATLQSQVEKRFRALIGDFDMIFKASGYVFDPAATSSEEAEERVPVNLAQTKAAVEINAAKALVKTGSDKPTGAKEPTTAPGMRGSTKEATEDKEPKELAKEPRTALPVTTLGAPSASASCDSDHGE